jgi:hypothetical protein
MSDTKVTTASVRVMHTFNFCHFEVALHLENEKGVSGDDVDNALTQCLAHTTKSVEAYKAAMKEIGEPIDKKSITGIVKHLKTEKSTLKRQI